MTHEQLISEIAALTKQANAYKLLTGSLERRNTTLASLQSGWKEAVSTLDSERQANAILTAEIAETAELMRDAERYRFASEHLILSGGTTKCGWPIASATRAEWDRYLDAAIAQEVKP